MPFIQPKQEEDENIEVYVKVPTPKPPRTKPITVALITAFATILVPIIAFLLPHLGAGTSSPNPSSPVGQQLQVHESTPTLQQQAKALIEQYFSDINNKDYQAAYNLWGVNFQHTKSLSDFSTGYAHSIHNDVTINNLTTLSDGMGKVDITIVATEETGPEYGTLKFLSGTLQKID
jgi:hypothetical protein